METLIERLRADFPQFRFAAGDVARWSSDSATISYTGTGEETATWGTLHELGHAQLGHTDYESDTELLKQEVAAWNRATELAASYGLAIQENYIERCLDSYRDWLHRRSTCPKCDAHGLEKSAGHYICLNCKAVWNVSGNRFCRTYRQKSIAR